MHDADLESVPQSQSLSRGHNIQKWLSPPTLDCAGVEPLTLHQVFFKRSFDVILAILGVTLLAPVMLAIACAIKVDSKGPVLFAQRREGIDGVPFRCLKFRSMYHSQTDSGCLVQAMLDDARVTVVGRVLRRLSLDELPQLFNVIAGHMSLVGPRPHAPETRAGSLLFIDAVPSYAMRHCVKPGITGWAQINGYRGQTPTVQSIERRVELDFYYIRNWSLALDIWILFRTVTREIFSGHAF